MGVKFADGWQKKSGHQVIRDQGNAARKSEQQKASLTTASAANKAAASSAGKAANKPVETSNGLPKTQQGVKQSGSQDQSARLNHADQAGKELLKVRQDAKDLQALSTKIKTTPNADKTATRNPVDAKNQAQGAEVKQHAAKPEQAAKIAQPAQAEAQVKVAKKGADTAAKLPKSKNAKGAKTKDGGKAAAKSKTQAQGAKEAASTGAFAQNAGIAGAQGQQGVLEIKSTAADDVDGKDDDGAEEDRDASTSAFAKGSSKLHSANKDLGGVLGGFSGDTTDGETGEGSVADVSGVKDAEKLPEKDPNFHVYSEFDSEKPGVEFAKARHQVYANLVEKRIKEIAQLDQEIGGRIRDIFETTPLSTRIVGELAGELETANFLKSVYGGLIG